MMMSRVATIRMPAAHLRAFVRCTNMTEAKQTIGGSRPTGRGTIVRRRSGQAAREFIR